MLGRVFGFWQANRLRNLPGEATRDPAAYAAGSPLEALRPQGGILEGLELLLGKARTLGLLRRCVQVSQLETNERILMYKLLRIMDLRPGVVPGSTWLT